MAELAGRVLKDRRPAIMTRIFLAYFGRELTTLIGCGLIWLLAGGGWRMRSPRIQTLHWRLLRWFVRGIAGRVLSTLQIEIAEDPGSEAADAALYAQQPLLILSRHAGPADTVLLIDRLLSHFGRRPSVVFREAIVLDPSVDLIAHRLPHAVLDADDPAQCEARIAQTAAALGPRGALLLFPEGGNFTRERRRHVLRSLRRSGHGGAADAGERMKQSCPLGRRAPWRRCGPIPRPTSCSRRTRDSGWLPSRARSGVSCRWDARCGHACGWFLGARSPRETMQS